MTTREKVCAFIALVAAVFCLCVPSFAATTTTVSTTTTVDTVKTTTTVTKEHTVTTNTSNNNYNNPSSDVAAKTGGTGTGKATTAASASTSSSVSNFKSLRRKTKMEKKAYSSLKTIENLAKKYGWTVKRTYTREKLSKANAKLWVITDVKLVAKKWTFSFRHCYHKTGRVIYQWNGKTILKKHITGLIKNPAKYYKK
ncbi:hypothetical protein IJG20_03245 [Candidatus Saccharibacteria bacterium]|nr:hypothetical protein [Candidatus Saccharibacteria bacterium]